MCNLYSMTSNSEAIRAAAKVMRNHTGNHQALSEIFPNTLAPIVRNVSGDRELTYARWGMPTPPAFIKGKVDRGITNIRHPSSAWWARWYGVEHRCLVPMSAFSEPERLPGGKSHPAWFTVTDEPLAFFAGIWTQWTSVRKLADGKTTDDLFGFLTTDANKEVAAVHPKAMPVILTRPEEFDVWMDAPIGEALQLQRPLGDGVLVRVSVMVKPVLGSIGGLP